MLTLHVLSVIFSFCVVIFSDKVGFSWIRGKKETLEHKTVQRLHVLTWIGLIALIITGVILFWPFKNYLLHQPLFIIKMLFVLALVINAFLIGRLMNVALERPFQSLTFSEIAPLMLSGAISIFSWFGALIVALVLFG